MVIYKTTNLINGKIYVGQDSKNNPNYLGSGNILKNAIKKYGIINFVKEILEYCNSQEDLNNREIFWIDFLNSKDKKIGYNLSNGGQFNIKRNGPSNKFWIYNIITEESKFLNYNESIPIGWKKGRPKKSLEGCNSLESRKKQGAKLKNRPKSDEHKEKLKNAAILQHLNMTEEEKEKRNNKLRDSAILQHLNMTEEEKEIKKKKISSNNRWKNNNSTNN